MPRRSTPQLLAIVLVAVGFAAALLLPSPYVVLSPGPVVDVLGSESGKPVLTVTGAPTYPTSGRLDLTTVNEAGGPRGRVPLTRVFGGWLDPTVAVVPTRLLYPEGQTSQQVEQQNTQQMLQSQDGAAVAALRYLHLPVTLVVTVGQITPGLPADGQLKVGDRIVEVDGVKVTTGDQVRDAVRKHKPGERVVLDIEREGRPQQVTLVTVPAQEDPKVAVVGFVPKDGYESPVTIRIDIEDIGGPSAGLMLTLGIIDKLTPQQENAGAHVAGTGTIDVDGRVGAIGGVGQKMAGARAEGATVFLVPAANCAEAVTQVPDGLRLVKVTDVEDAVSGMAAAVAGRAAPTCSP